MDFVFVALDLVIFLGCLVLWMGIVAGRKEESSQDF